MIFFTKTIYLLTVPTTYNKMLSYVIGSNFTNILLIDQVPQLNFPRLHPDIFYIKTKRNTNLNNNDIAFLNQLNASAHFNGNYLISESQLGKRLIYRADNNFFGSGYYATVEWGLGPYDPRYLFLNRLGRPIYLYDLFQTPNYIVKTWNF